MGLGCGQRVDPFGGMRGMKAPSKRGLGKASAEPALAAPPMPPLTAEEQASEADLIRQMEELIPLLRQRNLDNAVQLAIQAARHEGPLIDHFLRTRAAVQRRAFQAEAVRRPTLPPPRRERRRPPERGWQTPQGTLPPVNAYASTSLVEHHGLAVLMPFLEERAYRGRVVSTVRGTLAKTLQADFGDVLMNTDADTIWSIEIKVEQHRTGNLFLETWSNRNLDNKASHDERGCNPGWLLSSRADLLLYYFLDTDDLVIAPVFRLKRWAFGSGEEGGIYAWPEKRQNRYALANDNWGRCVPAGVIEREVGAKRMQVRQMPLFPPESTAGWVAR